MISAFFATLLGGIKTTIMLAVVGAFVGISAQVIGRLLGGMTGYLAAAALGALVLVGAYGSASFDSYRTKQKDAEIAQLKYDKAKQRQAIEAAEALAAKQEEIVKAAEERHVADAQQMIRLEQLAAKHKAEAEAEATEACPAPGAPAPKRGPIIYPDEIREIFRR